jgi:uncharacterized membrane protein YccC
MNEHSSKTWSQQVLAEHLLPADSPKSKLLSYEKRAMLLLALKTAMAAGICYWLAALAGLQDGYWGSISAIIVLQSNVGSTVTASRDRLIGTLIGAGFGAVFSLLGTELWIYLLAVVSAMVACSLLGLKNSSRLAAVTVTILMLVHRTGSNWTLPLHRVIEVLLGIVIALAVSTLVLPSRARMRLRDGLSQEYLLIGALFDAVMASLTTHQGDLSSLRRQVEFASAANTQLLDAARNEPAAGPASLEGLSLLHQFARSLENQLHALELAVGPAVENSDGPSSPGYIAQLQPELDHLAAEMHRQFSTLARLIHLWRFDDDPETASALDIFLSALDTKMAAIRPSGLHFPQPEIFRAYAVQLHLKQLAQLLQSSRSEVKATAA